MSSRIFQLRGTRPQGPLVSHWIFWCFVYPRLWSKGHRSREIFESAFIKRFQWNRPGFILVSSDSLGGFGETSKFLAVLLKPFCGVRARIWPEMAKSKISRFSLKQMLKPPMVSKKKTVQNQKYNSTVIAQFFHKKQWQCVLKIPC